MITDEELSAIRWLRGTNGSATETIRTADGRRIVTHLGNGDGRAALIRLLQGSEPLSTDVRNTLANAFQNVGVSPLRAEVVLVRRGGRRGGRPSREAKKALEQIMMGRTIEDAAADPVRGGKEYMVAEEVARAGGKGRTTGLKAFAARRRARQVRGEN